MAHEIAFAFASSITPPRTTRTAHLRPQSDSNTPLSSPMASNKGPDLRRYMDKVLSVKLNGSRTVTGVLRGYDSFLNVVLKDAKEEVSGFYWKRKLETY